MAEHASKAEAEERTGTARGAGRARTAHGRPARLLLGVVPLTRHDLHRIGGFDAGQDSMLALVSPPGVWSNLLQPEMWIGAAAGIAMLLLATRLRRWREEG